MSQELAPLIGWLAILIKRAEFGFLMKSFFVRPSAPEVSRSSSRPTYQQPTGQVFNYHLEANQKTPRLLKNGHRRPPPLAIGSAPLIASAQFCVSHRFLDTEAPQTDAGTAQLENPFRRFMNLTESKHESYSP